MKQISPTNDWAFKKVFSSEEHKDILCGIIGDTYNIKLSPADITLTNPYSIDVYKESIGGDDINTIRYNSRDIKATFDTADFVFELQVRKTPYFSERSLYYPLESFCSNYNKTGHMEIINGKLNRYSSLRPVFALNILGYNHFKDDGDSLRIFELYDPVRDKYFGKDLLRIAYFELTKKKFETQNQKHWCDYFSGKEISPEAPDYIKKAVGAINWVNLKEEERDMADRIEKGQAIYEAEYCGAYRDGEEKGMVTGIAVGEARGQANAIARIKQFIKEGLSPEEAIARFAP